MLSEEDEKMRNISSNKSQPNGFGKISRYIITLIRDITHG